MDMIPGGDPKEIINEVSTKLKEKFDECGMGEVEGFVTKLDEVKDMVDKGPAELINKMREQFDEFKKKINDLMEDPQSLAPSGSALANCAGWYGKSVCTKLKAFNEDVQEVISMVLEMVDKLKDPIKNLGDTLTNAMQAMDGTVKKLAKLPQSITDLGAGITGPEDVAKIEMDPINQCLDVSSISSPLDLLAGLKEPLKEAVDRVKKGVQRILDFIADAPDKVKKAFSVPTPCCCLQSCLLSKAPAALTQLMGLLDGMKEVKLDPVITGFETVQTTICNFDVAKIKEPVEKFAAAAKDPVDSLDTAVKGAKLATGGGGGAMGLLDQAKGFVGL